jgi:putative redox protein
MAAITVTEFDADRFQIRTRGHTILVDQPRDDVEVGPSPVEMMVMSMAGCAAYYAARYLRSNALNHCGLRVDCAWSMRSNPPRVARVQLTVRTPDNLDPVHREGMLAAVEGCTVTNTLADPPSVEVITAPIDTALHTTS